MLAFFSIIFISSVSLLIYFSIKRKEVKQVKVTQENQQFLVLTDAENNLSRTKSVMFNTIQKHFGDQVSQNILEEKIWENMPSYLLIISWGVPQHKKESVYRGKKVESWFYGAYLNRLSNIKYRFEVMVENEFVIGWKDLS